MKEAKQHVFCDYTEIKKEVDTMVSNVLELKSLKMRDEAVKQAKQETVKKIVIYMRQQGIDISDEKAQDLLKVVSGQINTEGNIAL